MLNYILLPKKFVFVLLIYVYSGFCCFWYRKAQGASCRVGAEAVCVHSPAVDWEIPEAVSYRLGTEKPAQDVDAVVWTCWGWRRLVAGKVCGRVAYTYVKPLSGSWIHTTQVSRMVGFVELTGSVCQQSWKQGLVFTQNSPILLWWQHCTHCHLCCYCCYFYYYYYYCRKCMW